MKYLLLLLTTVVTLQGYSQINFEKGYYITNFNEKIDCLIKNMDWKNNPDSFEYQLSENDKTEKMTIASIKEFGIYNHSKYIKAKVAMDRSSEIVKKLSSKKEPIFKKEELLLKVLVEGKASLYLFEESNLTRYFYAVDNSKIEQLVYKSYITMKRRKMLNAEFKKQLLDSLKCSSLTLDKIKELQYNTKDLSRFFMEYNNCDNPEFKVIEEKKARNAVHLALRPRFNNSSFSISNAQLVTRNIDFGQKTSFGFGAELEYVFPFNKNKWSIFIEPTYQGFKSEKTVDAPTVSGFKIMAIIDYSSIEIPIGFRHYLFLTDNSKIFINAAYVFDITSNHVLEFYRADNTKFDTITIASRSNFALGLGFKFKDRYSLEFRYFTSRELLKSGTYDSQYDNTSVILGYSLF